MLWLLKNVLLTDKMCMTRLALSVGSLFWALQLLPPTELFLSPQQAILGSGKTPYSLLAALASEMVWGSLFLVHAVWAMYSLVSSNSKGTLYADGFLGCFLWTMVTTSGYSAYWPEAVSVWAAMAEYQPPAAMTGSLILSLVAWWHMIRLWAEE